MPESDIEKLRRHINLPAEPRSVKWETDQSPGGNDWALTALLEFDTEVIAKLLLTSPSLGGTPRVSAEHLKAWFPADIVKAAAGIPHSQVGASLVVDATRVEATAFIAPGKSPLVQGDALVFPTARLVYLRLFTM